MFNTKEKQHIARELEKILLKLNHPEMTKGRAYFRLHVEGAEKWSWADIIANHQFEPKPTEKNWELNLCPKCNQMTNHKNGKCLKCKPTEEKE